ncbi:MAG TPA: hypothetical protein VFW68_00490 [Rhodocyclaceae bacterium]|nr:hypothetical protein [Rhodocyclaceae bacterium]
MLFVTVPVFKGLELLFGSDELSSDNADKEAKAVLAAHPSIPVTGLYVESISVRYGLYGMLVARKLPLVEADLAGSKWLFELAKDPQTLEERAHGNKYVRLSLGSQESLDCFNWKSESDNWARAAPVKPGTCLRVEFDNSLVSDARLHINLAKVGKRELRWEITQIKGNASLIAIPFWIPQVSGYPLNFGVHYQSVGDSSAFSDLMKKLVPSTPHLDADGRPYVLDWDRSGIRRELPFSKYINATAVVRRSSESLDDAKDREDWEQAYHRAKQRRQPTLINNHFIVLPESDQIYGDWNDFEKRFVTDCCVFSLKPSGPLKYPTVVTGERFTGEPFWHLNLNPGSHPDEVSWCTNSPETCYFETDGIKVTNSELIIVGRYTERYAARDRRSLSENYEWVVPLSSLPRW